MYFIEENMTNFSFNANIEMICQHAYSYHIYVKNLGIVSFPQEI